MLPDTDQKRDESRHQVEEVRRVAEAVRAACVEAALRGYEEAKISGLCHEGAWECAVDAIRMMDIEPLVGQRVE